VSEARSVVVHGHFYQPPRENPRTGVLEAEANAAPDHDWNARITRECYAPLARIPVGPDPAHATESISAYAWMSFDVGPTLVTWLETEAPEVLAAMLKGDHAARARLGTGNAMAMPYHHVILPLCTRRDKVVELRWGIADFRRVFGREPEGLWLPETAVDDETLDVAAQLGIAFTVLAPSQVVRAPADGSAGRYRTGGRRSIAVFAYEGAVSHDIAFGPLLKDSLRWERAMIEGGRDLMAVATDGETYGHHHKFADLALGALLFRLSRRPGLRLENFASALARGAPTVDISIVSPSSWSCEHGVGRWRTECGCRIRSETQQRWRAPLREAVDWLVEQVRAEDEDPRTRTALAALTSCGWFFDDFAGLEGRQILRYVARSIALAEGDGPRLESGFLERLDGAVSNDPAVGTARQFYLERVRTEK
jgi:alpha-amylase/alpha-mannosidase (GH57 family)